MFQATGLVNVLVEVVAAAPAGTVMETAAVGMVGTAPVGGIATLEVGTGTVGIVATVAAVTDQDRTIAQAEEDQAARMTDTEM